MNDMLANLLRSRRADLHLLQADVAIAIGVSRAALSKWERGVAAPSRGRLQDLARVLDVPVERLLAALGSRPARTPGRDPRYRRPRPRRKPYPQGATLEQVLREGTGAQSIHRRAVEVAGAVSCEKAIAEFPRDTRHELLAVLGMLGSGARLVEARPSRYACHALILDDFEWVYGGDQLQPALFWRGQDEWMLIFGQVRVRGGVHWAYRLDFLIYYKRRGRRGQWVIHELDGFDHLTSPHQDANRTEAIGLPEVRHDNEKTQMPWYFERLLADVRARAEEGEVMARDRKRKARKRRKKRELEAQQRRAAV